MKNNPVFNLGDKVSVTRPGVQGKKPKEDELVFFRPTEGTVVYVHPKRYFYGVEFLGKYVESFYPDRMEKIN